MGGRTLTAIVAASIVVATLHTTDLFHGISCYETIEDIETCSAVFRNVGLILFGMIGIIIAIRQLRIRWSAYENEVDRTRLDRLSKAVENLSSEKRAVSYAGVRILHEIAKSELDQQLIIGEILYRHFQEERTSLDRSAIDALAEIDDETEWYARWIERPKPDISPVRFLDVLPFEEYQPNRIGGRHRLSLRGSSVSVNSNTVLTKCDLSDATVVVHSGCSLINCDLTRARLILRNVARTSDLALHHCNLSRCRFEPSMPPDYCIPETSRTGWCWEDAPPVSGDCFGMPNLDAEPLFSFHSCTGRQVSVSQRRKILSGEVSVIDVRGPFGVFDDDEFSFAGGRA